MGFRTIVVKNRCKLDLKMNYLVCRGDEETKVFIPEISYLVLESTAISLTTALLCELTKNNVKVIFCDEKHNPHSELVGLYNNYINVGKINKQLLWNGSTNAVVWQEIIKNKIYQQQLFLQELGFNAESELLEGYLLEVCPSDETNREGHAAKVYFNALFGNNFARRDESKVNAALNYGYAILLSCFNREVVKQGYLTQIGIWHKNDFNYFNLSCDIMEPFRILVDRIVYKMFFVDKVEVENFKEHVLEIFNTRVIVGGKKQFFENAVAVYCQSVLDSLNNNDVSLIKFYEL